MSAFQAFARWVADARWMKNMRRARRFRRTLTARQQIAFDFAFQPYLNLQTDPQTHFEGYLRAIRSALEALP